MPPSPPYRWPLLMEPVAVAKAWGGGDPIGEGRLGETWEVSDAPGHQSVAVSPSGDRMPFGSLIAAHRAAAAGDVPFLPPDDRFPLLVKHLHALGRTSIQVHPCDDLARAFGEGHPGKMEAWVIVEAERSADVLVGFSRDVSPEELPPLLASGGVVPLLNRVTPTVGTCVPVPPGTIHAIGGGVTVFEVQTNSHVTYRLYDWGREREAGLHLSRGLACLDTSALGAPAAAPVPSAAAWGTRTLLYACEAFAIERWTPASDAPLPTHGRFLVVTSLGRDGGVGYPGGHWPALPRRTWFVPAAAEGVSLRAGGDYLVCFVPRPGR